MTLPAFADLRGEYARLWSSMTINPERLAEFNGAARRLYSHRVDYAAVTAATGVPLALIAVIHEREASGNFACHLHNGDPLTQRTYHVPAGRPATGNPPFTWTESAIDALKYEGMDKIVDWSLERGLFVLEGYNGWGYYGRGLRSPYLWGGTNQQQPGKYVADGQFDPSAMDGQLGCAGLLAALFAIDPKLRDALPAAAAPPSPPPPPPPAPRFDADAVKSVQRGLATLGFYRDAIDGDPGPHTKAASTAFAAAI